MLPKQWSPQARKDFYLFREYKTNHQGESFIYGNITNHTIFKFFPLKVEGFPRKLMFSPCCSGRFRVCLDFWGLGFFPVWVFPLLSFIPSPQLLCLPALVTMTTGGTPGEPLAPGHSAGTGLALGTTPDFPSPTTGMLPNPTGPPRDGAIGKETQASRAPHATPACPLPSPREGGREGCRAESSSSSSS